MADAQTDESETRAAGEPATASEGGQEEAPGAVPTSGRGTVTRWGGDKRILGEGFVAVPVSFLTGFAKIRPYGLTIPEAMLVLELMVFKWDAKQPYPSYGTLADRMGVSTAYARKLARKLETKGFLARTVRKGETNEFDLEPLFKRFTAYADEQVKKRRPKKTRV